MLDREPRARLLEDFVQPPGSSGSVDDDGCRERLLVSRDSGFDPAHAKRPAAVVEHERRVQPGDPGTNDDQVAAVRVPFTRFTRFGHAARPPRTSRPGRSPVSRSSARVTTPATIVATYPRASCIIRCPPAGRSRTT